MMNRREFMSLVSAGVAANVLAGNAAASTGRNPAPRAVVFDAFSIFDPRPVFARVEELFPGKGSELSNAWRTRQFEYQWLRALTGHYADFRRATEDALIFSAKLLKLDLTTEKRERLMQAYMELRTWPDVPAALDALKSQGLSLAFLSNISPKMLSANIKHAKLEGVFDRVLSTDQVRTYKPDPRAYQLAIDALRIKREEIVFVPSSGWDAAGAKWFGYRTFWVNHLGLPPEELGTSVDATGNTLADLAGFVGT